MMSLAKRQSGVRAVRVKHDVVRYRHPLTAEEMKGDDDDDDDDDDEDEEDENLMAGRKGLLEYYGFW